ncbi:MAG: hypothetical protein ACWGMZ_07335, partial [Thermoguttaceae bacterium]
MLLRLGARASALSRSQAEWAAGELRALGATVKLVLISTTGDRHLGPLPQIGSQGVFVKEIQRALLEG